MLYSTHIPKLASCSKGRKILFDFNSYNIIWAMTWQKQQSGMLATRRLRSAWTFVQSDQSLCWVHKSSCGSKQPRSWQQRLWSGLEAAQADLILHGGNMSLCCLCYVLAHLTHSYLETRKKGHRQTVQIQIRCHIMWHLIRSYIVC